MPNLSFRAFLGNGIVRPFRRDQKSDFANARDVLLVRSCVGQIVGTMAANDAGDVQGEIPWRPEFGSLLYKLKHTKGRIRDELARVHVIDALSRWEPRVRIQDAWTEFADRVLTVHILYDVIDRNVPGNNVIAKDVEQSVSVPLAA